MTLSRGAIGNLVNRYRAVLRKCRMMNVFGSLAVAGMLVAGNAGFAGAEELSGDHFSDIFIRRYPKYYWGWGYKSPVDRACAAVSHQCVGARAT